MCSWLAINLCRLTLGGQTVKNLRRLAYEFELDQSQRKSTRNAIPNETQVERKSKTCVDLHPFASPFGQSSTGQMWTVEWSYFFYEVLTAAELNAWALREVTSVYFASAGEWNKSKKSDAREGGDVSEAQPSCESTGGKAERTDSCWKHVKWPHPLHPDEQGTDMHSPVDQGSYSRSPLRPKKCPKYCYSWGCTLSLNAT